MGLIHLALEGVNADHVIRYTFHPGMGAQASIRLTLSEITGEIDGYRGNGTAAVHYNRTADYFGDDAWALLLALRHDRSDALANLAYRRGECAHSFKDGSYYTGDWDNGEDQLEHIGGYCTKCGLSVVRETTRHENTPRGLIAAGAADDDLPF